MRCRSVLIAVLLGALLLFVSSTVTHAEFVHGSVGFNGNGSVSQSSGITMVSFGPMTIDLRTGDYRTIPAGTTVALAPISWTGSGNNAVLASNNNPEWKIIIADSIYQYSITALSNASFAAATNAVVISGFGVAYIAGVLNRDPTYVSFSVQGLNGQFTFDMVQSCNFNCGPTGPPLADAGSSLALLATAAGVLLLLRIHALLRFI